MNDLGAEITSLVLNTVTEMLSDVQVQRPLYKLDVRQRPGWCIALDSSQII